VTTHFQVSIGNAAITVDGEISHRHRAALLTRYADYLSERPPDLRIEFRCAADSGAAEFLEVGPSVLTTFGSDHGGEPGSPFPHGEPRSRIEEWLQERRARIASAESPRQDPPLRVVPLGARTLVERPGFAGTVNPCAGEARCVFAAENAFFAVGSLLRVGFSFLAVQHGGLLLHAAGVARNGRAYVFAGPSGAGKSTIAGLSEGKGTILGDEMMCVQGGPDGDVVLATPFHGTNTAPPFFRGAPLAAVLLPVKADRIETRVLPEPEALRRLLAATLFFDASADGRQRLLDVASALVRRVPVLEMQFTRDPAFWDALDSLCTDTRL